MINSIRQKSLGENVRILNWVSRSQAIVSTYRNISTHVFFTTVSWRKSNSNSDIQSKHYYIIISNLLAVSREISQSFLTNLI